MKHPAQLIVAVDVPAAEGIPTLVSCLPPEVAWYKIGLELFIAEGASALSFLKEQQKNIFLDLKLHDIPRTVARAVTAAAEHDVGLLTLHAGGGRAMLAAAAEAAAQCKRPPRLVAVTTLTSLDNDDLTELGVERNTREHTLALGQLAIDCGIDGLVCSALEVASFRSVIGPDPLLVTPGIRPSGGDVGDQKRVATPSMAVAAGSNFLVVGRPILEAADPAAAASAILNEMTSR
jgi:orotidine-5'-phosphate decarboxylase